MTLAYFVTITMLLTYLINSALVCYSKKPQNKEAYRFYIVLAYLVYMFVTVFRPMGPGLGGTDTWGYRNYFLSSRGSLMHGLTVQTYEKGYAFFVWFVRLFTTEYRVVLFLVHSFIFVSTVSFLKKIRFNKYSFITIMALVFLALDSINIVRIIVAVCISYYLYDALYQGRIYKALGIILLASSVHISAVILFVVYFIYIVKRYEKDFSLDKLMILTFVFMIGTFIAIHVMDSIINQTKYVFYDQDEGIAFPSYIMFLGVFLVSIMQYKKLVKFDKINEVLIYALSVGLVILPLQYRYAIMYRMLLYIHPIMFTLIPAIFVEDEPSFDEHKLTKIAINCMLVMFIVYRIYSFFTGELVDLGSFGGF
ncbi:hypothetical protein AOC36_02550 [Erysipelothrix larvae]|uniref:EpsG family protein n=1 Tax=Erysipelothrix larvae TaxID=1514105 RepID=A0A0X8GYS6_9FIRM|nr:EpsG family protein [Erysipelothrix larvae]AMC92902.1 hypothetical protein AOC36_02550 [Erysipelothrix larvae]